MTDYKDIHECERRRYDWQDGWERRTQLREVIATLIAIVVTALVVIAG